MTARKDLAEQLRISETELEFLAPLDDSEIKLIMHGMESAVAAQKKQINDAIEESLTHVPRLLHKPLRRVLFGQK